MFSLALKKDTKYEQVSFTQYFAASYLWVESLNPLLQKILFYASNILYLAILFWGQLQFVIDSPNSTALLYGMKKIPQLISLQSLLTSKSSMGMINALNGIVNVYLLILLVTMLLTIKGLRSKKEFSRPIGAIVNSITYFHVTIGFWITNIILLSVFNVSQADDSDLADDTSRQIVNFIFVVFNYIVGLLGCILSHDPLTSTNFLSCHTPMYQILTFLLKATLSPVAHLYQNYSFASWYFVLFSLFISTFRHFNLLQSFPYHHYHPMKASVLFSSVSVIVSLYNIVLLPVGYQTWLPAGSVFFSELLIIPLALKFSSAFFERTILNYLATPNHLLSSELEVIKKLFALNYLIDVTNTPSDWTQRVGRFDLQILGAMSMFLGNQITNNRSFLITEGKTLEISQIKRRFQLIGGNLIKMLLIEAIKKLKDSNKLKMILSNRMANNVQTIKISITYLANISDQQSFKKFIMIKAHQKLQQKIDILYARREDGVLNIKKLIDQAILIVKFTEFLHSATSRVADFWASFKKSDLKIVDLFNKNVEIETKDAELRKFWNKNIEPHKRVAASLSTLYSIYLSLVRNAPFSAFTVSENHPPIVSLKNQLHEEDTQINESNLTSQKNVILSASMSRDKLGKIIYASSNITEIIGWSQRDIIGNNVSLLMPPSFREKHNQILQKHIEENLDQNKKSKMYRNLDSTILSKKGQSFPCSVYIAIHPYIQQELVYVAIVRVTKPNESRTFLDTDTMGQTAPDNFHSLMKMISPIHEKVSASKMDSYRSENVGDSKAFSSINENQLERAKSKIADELPPVKQTAIGNLMKVPVTKGLSEEFLDDLKEIKSEDDETMDIPEEKVIVKRLPKITHQAPSVAEDSDKEVKPSLPKEPKEAVQRKFTNLVSRMTTHDRPSVQISSQQQLSSLSMHVSHQNKLAKKELTHIVDMSVAPSSSLSSTKYYISKLEQAVYAVPKTPTLQRLRIFAILFGIFAIACLVVFKTNNDSILSSLQGNIEILSSSTLRLFRIVETNRLVRFYALVTYGVLLPTRYSFISPGADARSIIDSSLTTTSEELANYNSEIRQSLYLIDKSLQGDFYSSLIPIYQFSPTYTSEFVASSNMFDTAVEMVARASSVLHTSYDQLTFANADIAFVILNSLNELLLTGENVISILREDNKEKLNKETELITALASVTTVFAVAFLLYFFWLEKHLIKDRNRIIDIFLRLDEKAVESHVSFLTRFEQTLEKDSIDTRKLNFRLNSMTFSNLAKKGGAKELGGIYRRKRASRTGVNRDIILLNLLMVISAVLIISAFFFSLLIVSDQNSSILQKIELMMDSNLNLYNTNFAFTCVYEYIYTNMSSTVRGMPITEEWDITLQSLSQAQEQFTNIIDPDSGINNPTLTQLIKGSVCEVIGTSSGLKSFCNSFSGGILNQGIIGGTSLLILTIQRVKDAFDASAKSVQDMQNALADSVFVSLEVLAETYLFPAFEMIDSIIKDTLISDLTSFKGKFELAIILFIIVYIVILAILWWKIEVKFRATRNGWRQLFRLIPHNMVTTNKLLKDYLISHSNGLLETVKRYFT